jgi:hypothetical protein
LPFKYSLFLFLKRLLASLLTLRKLSSFTILVSIHLSEMCTPSRCGHFTGPYIGDEVVALVWPETHYWTARSRLNIECCLGNRLGVFGSPLVTKYGCSLYSRSITVFSSDDTEPVGCHGLVSGQHKISSLTCNKNWQEKLTYK